MHRLRFEVPAATALLVLASLSAPAGAAGAADPSPPSTLAVSPLLVDAAAEVWGIIAKDDNPVWPGWNASDTPLLLYLPGQQDLLIGHPKPPDGFHPYSGPLRFPGAAMLVKDGPTLIGFDGQNTAMDVAGVRTLVVADPLSNLRQRVTGLLEDPRPVTEKTRGLELADLAPNPYDQLALIVHEAFHVHQEHAAPGRGANEMLLLYYPVLSVENNVGFGLEGEALARVLRAGGDAPFRAAALRWLAAREHRRALLSARAREYEDGIEFSEGTAKYTEYRLFEVLEGRTAPPALERAQGFHGYADLSPQRRDLETQMRRNMRGEVIVNNDPYGTAPLRMRLYYSGMAIGVVLDRLRPGWKHELFTTDSSLTALARAALRATPAELASAWEADRADTAYATLLAAKTRLAEDGRRRTATRVAAIERGPGTGLVLDYSALGSPKVGLAFTPFGITAVDSVRTIFDQVPISASFADQSKLAETIALPLIRDTHRRTLRCRLEHALTRAEIERIVGPGRVGSTRPQPMKLELPGVTLDLKHATLAWRDGTLFAALHPDSTAGGAATPVH